MQDNYRNICKPLENNYRNICKIGRQTAGMTQERWAEAIDYSVESVRLCESGKQIPGDDVVLRMIEVAGMPVLGYWHMLNKSRMAAEILPEVETVPLPQAVLALICRIRDFAEKHRTDALMNIAADGVIDEHERPEFDAIVRELEGVVQAALTLKYSER